MKTILFLAVLLFAAQSSPLNEFYRGFIQNLPMNASVQNEFMNSGLNCLNDFEAVAMNLIQTLQRDIPAKNYIDILRTLLVADDVLEHRIAPQCLVVLQQLEKFFSENRVSRSSDRMISEEWEKAHRNFNETYGYNEYWKDQNEEYDRQKSIVQKQTSFLIIYFYESLFHIIEDVVTGKVYNAGERFAFIVKLANGMEKAELQLVKDEHISAPFNLEKFIMDFIPSLLNELSSDSYNNNQTFMCVLDLVNTTQTAWSRPEVYRADVFTATHVFLEGALKLTDALQRCADRVDLRPFGRLGKLFINYPFRFLGKVYLNQLSNLTHDIEAQMNLATLLKNGDYSAAGKQYAKHIKIMLKDLAF